MKRLCFTDQRKLCCHGVRLTEPCEYCVAAERRRGDKGGFVYFDGSTTGWREVTSP